MKMTRVRWAMGLVAMIGLLGLPGTQAAGARALPAADQSRAEPIDLDVLFVSAHPDDEGFTLSTFGQWKEFDDLDAGFVTLTRGEGGGNAIGTEEGAALGLIREREEREAVGWAL